MMRALGDLFLLGHGEAVDRWEHHFGIYERELGPLRDSGEPVDLLEAGSGSARSLELWGRYFPVGSTIVALDADATAAGGIVDGRTVAVHAVDATDPNAVRGALGGRSFDVVIHGVSRRSDDVAATFEALFDSVKPGGFYIVEDRRRGRDPVQTSVRPASEASIEWLKRLVDAVDRGHLPPDAATDESRWFARLSRRIARVSVFESLAIVQTFVSEKAGPFRLLPTDGEGGPAADLMALPTSRRSGPSGTVQTVDAAPSGRDPELTRLVREVQDEVARLGAEVARLSAVQASLLAAMEADRRAAAVDGTAERHRYAVGRAISAESGAGAARPAFEGLRQAPDRADGGRLRRLALRARQGISIAPQGSAALPNSRARRGLDAIRSRFRGRPDEARVAMIASLFSEGWYRENHPEISSSRLSPLEHYIRVGAARGWDPHPLFSVGWYDRQVPGLAASNIHPVVHYLTVGAGAGLQPHPMFDGDWYLRRNPDVRAAGHNPLLHYVNSGRSEERDPHELFDASWYLRTYREAAAATVTPLEHFVMAGPASGLDPHPLFSSAFYGASHPDVVASGLIPAVHFIVKGYRDRYDPHPLFDIGYYLDFNPDVRAADGNALAHFIDVGGSEGRSPNTCFASRWYLDRNPDVAALNMNPLRHYVDRGALEGRAPHPAFDLKAHPDSEAFTQPWGRLAQLVRHTMPEAIAAIEASGMFASQWYAGQVADKEANGGLVRHYLSIGTVQGLSPHPLFNAKWYAARYPDSTALQPFLHYALHGVAEGRQPGPLVGLDHFAARRGHPEDADLDPLAFFLRHGLGDAAATTPLFDPRWYASQHADLMADGADPLLHFATVGMAAGLSPNPAFDPAWYDAKYAATAETGLTAFEHYTAFGFERRLHPGPFFDPKFYLQSYADIAASGVDPLEHYLDTGRAEHRHPIGPARPQRIAVVCHFYYADLLGQLRLHLKTIGTPFDLYVTHSPSLGEDVLRQLKRITPRTTLIPVPDVGFDIAPFLVALDHIRQRRDPYLCICKIHTKKGRTRPDVWRHLLLNSVLGSRKLVGDIVRGFAEDPSLALVGGRELYIDGEMFSADNRKALGGLQRDLYPGSSHVRRWGFFAGSMFWCRPELFYPLAELLTGHHSFEHSARSDGQLAHSVERMFGFVAAAERRRVGLIDLSADGEPRWDRHIQDAGRWTSVEPIHLLLERMAASVRPNLAGVGTGTVRSARTWTPAPGESPGVRLVGPVRAVNGIAVSTRGYLRALEAAGSRVAVQDWKIGFERLKTLDLDLPPDGDEPIQITHLNLDLLDQVAAFAAADFEKLLVPSRYNILVPYFELVSLKPEWVDMLARFDEVWCASTFLQRALNAASRVRTRVVRPTILPELVAEGDFSRHDFGLPRDRFVFGYFADAGSVLARKNPLGFVEAYVDEFSERDGTCCFVKVHYGQADDPTLARIAEIASRRRDVVFSDAVYSHREMEALVALLDCYVSPHRSEGLGLTIVEAMNAGVPVVATGYGGAIDMLRPEASLPVPYRLAEVGPGNAPYPPFHTWADPEPAALRAAMRSLSADPERARRIGAAGRAHVRDLFGEEATGRAVRAALDDIWRTATAAAAGRGE